MEKVSLNLPLMYGDHHVLAVRDILGRLDGVEDVYATSAFKQVIVKFDATKVSQADMEKALADQGYPVGVEPTIPVWQPRQQEGPRFVAASGIAQMTSFQVPELNVGAGGPRPCPGFEFRELKPGGVHPGDE